MHIGKNLLLIFTYSGNVVPSPLISIRNLNHKQGRLDGRTGPQTAFDSLKINRCL